jgi:ATP-dependent protease HslVU (ClpYQ) peptidase subunit
LHAVRNFLTKIMLDDSKGLKEVAKVAKNSSVRAYAGHSASFRHIFDVKSLNLTEYARSFGIYKVVRDAMDKTKSWVDPRNVKKIEELKNKVGDVNEGVATELFTKRL